MIKSEYTNCFSGLRMLLRALGSDDWTVPYLQRQGLDGHVNHLRS